MAPRTTLQTLRVLQALLGGPERYGLELCELTELPAGTVYPILARFERTGLVTSRWEEPARQEAEGRPRRRYYRLTPDGAQFAREALATTYRAGRKVRLQPNAKGGPA